MNCDVGIAMVGNARVGGDAIIFIIYFMLSKYMR